MCQFAERITADGGPETLFDTFNEFVPRQSVAAVLLEPVIPLLGSPFHVEGCHPDLLILWSALGAEELLRLVKPTQRIFGALVLGKSELVDRSRTLGNRGPVRGERTLLLQHLRLDVVQGARETPLFQLDGGDLIVDLVANFAHLGDHLVDGILELLLGDELVAVVAHGCGKAVGLAVRRGWWGGGRRERDLGTDWFFRRGAGTSRLIPEMLWLNCWLY